MKIRSELAQPASGFAFQPGLRVPVAFLLKRRIARGRLFGLIEPLQIVQVSRNVLFVFFQVIFDLRLAGGGRLIGRLHLLLADFVVVLKVFQVLVDTGRKLLLVLGIKRFPPVPIVDKLAETVAQRAFRLP